MIKRILLPLVFALAMITACGQKPEIKVPYKYEGVSLRFVDHFNAQRFDSIYMMYSDTVRPGVSEKDYTTALYNMYKGRGKIKALTFEQSIMPVNSSDSTALFRLDFERSPEPSMLAMTLDSEKSFLDLWFLPYKNWAAAFKR